MTSETDENKSGWSWFMAGETKPTTEKELAQNYARCFSTPDGARVLAHLQNITLNRALGPSAKNGLLRHLEGQRQLVSFIAAQIRRGQQG